MLLTNPFPSDVEIVVRTCVVEGAHFHVELIDQEVNEAMMIWNAHCPDLSLVTVWQVPENSFVYKLHCVYFSPISGIRTRREMHMPTIGYE